MRGRAVFWIPKVNKMNEITQTKNIQTTQTSAGAVEQLSSILATYNETTNRLYSSYQNLKKEVNRLRGELKQKNEQLERKNRLAALGEMAAGMAHEIRNPLGGVQLYASLLERELQEQDNLQQWAQKIIMSVNSLDMIVNDILTFTQEQSCQKIEVELKTLILEVMDYVKPQIKSEAVRVELGGVPGKLTIRADINMLRRVLLNLMLNALEAVESRGEVSIRAEEFKGDSDFKTCICVSDTGKGIKPEDMGKIFNPFFTTKDTGTGLGLAIVHRLVECQGGVITASNSKISGATFTILLP